MTHKIKMHKLLNSFLAVNEKERFWRKLSCRVGFKKKAISEVCSFSIRLPNAKPAKIQRNRKQGFKKDVPQHLNQTTFEYKVLLFQDIFPALSVCQEFCILLLRGSLPKTCPLRFGSENQFPVNFTHKYILVKK